MRYKIGLLVLAVCVVLGWGTAQAGHEESNSTTVAVNIAASIAVVAWPENFLVMSRDVVPGDEVISSPVAISVKANSPWSIEISCDLPDGRMKEFDLGMGAYVSSGSLLTHPLQWSTSRSGSWQPLSSVPNSIVASQPPTDNNGQTVEFYLRQVADYGDRPLEDGRDYRINLHYTAGLSY